MLAYGLLLLGLLLLYAVVKGNGKAVFSAILQGQTKAGGTQGVPASTVQGNAAP